MNDLLNRTSIFCKRHGATILTCLGGVGVVATTALAIKATPKALEIIDICEEEKGEELTAIEKVSVAWKPYVPTVLIGAGTLACIFGANVLNKHQQASLISAYTLIDNSYREYQAKLKELYGEEAHQEIVDAIAAEKAKNVGVRAPGYVDSSTLFVDEHCGDNRLFYDEYGDRFFETTLEQVISAEYHLNRNFILRGYTTLNELYDFLGLEPTDYGDTVGWAVEDELYWIDFNQRKTTINNNVECCVIEMPWGPSPNFLEYHY